MIAAWMLWTLAATLLLSAAAGAADAALRALGRPTRGLWAVAIAASLVAPGVAWRVQTRAAPAASAPSAELPAVAAADAAADPAALDALLARTVVRVEASSRLAALDRPLALLWGAASIVLLVGVVGAQARLRQARREWRHAVVDDAPVLVSRRTGPALAGVWRTAVVLPEWALRGDAALLRLMLSHEREHQRAGDPRLLAAATMAVALAPWNLALWYQRSRLRLAVEIDCDRRVLRRHPDVRRYGALLLEVGRRATGARTLPLAALTASTTMLERRIRTMTMRRPRRPLLRGFVLLAASTALASVALALPRPQRSLPATGVRDARLAQPGRDIIAIARQFVAERAPELLGAPSGEPVLVGVLVDADGRLLDLGYERVRDASVGSTAGATSRAQIGTARRVLAGLRDLEPDAIASVDILTLAAGRVAADSTRLAWVRLKSADERAGDRAARAEDERRAARASAIVEGTTAASSARASAGSTASASVRGERTAETVVAGRLERAAVEQRAAEAGNTTRLRALADTARVDEVVVAGRASPASGGTYSFRADTSRTIAERIVVGRAAVAAGGVAGDDERDLAFVGRPARSGDAVVSLRAAPGAAQPLYVIDGILVERTGTDNPVDALVPDQIESVEVIKGAAAERLYGARAANGVVLITTKAHIAPPPAR